MSSPADNVFVSILTGELPSYGVYSDEATYAFLDINPHAPGHTLVIPRSYSEHLLDAGEPDISACIRAVRRLLPAILAATGAKAATILTNMGRDAGQTVPYLHFHIIPRPPASRLSGEPGAGASPDDLAEMADHIRRELGTVS